MTLHRIRMKKIIDGNDFQTHVQIFNYDYTIYTIIASMNTLDQGALGFNLSYRGGEKAHMYVTQYINNMTYTYKYDFPANIFMKTFKKILAMNLKQCNYKCIYTGCTDIVGLINNVLQWGEEI